MNLGTDMMGNEPHDALAVGRGETLAGICQASRQPINPEPAIGIEHDLDDRSVFEPGRDRWPERGSQHARAARYNFGLVGMNCHGCPPDRRDKGLGDGDQ
jgi:hypothetical protein